MARPLDVQVLLPKQQRIANVRLRLHRLKISLTNRASNYIVYGTNPWEKAAAGESERGQALQVGSNLEKKNTVEKLRAGRLPCTGSRNL